MASNYTITTRPATALPEGGHVDDSRTCRARHPAEPWFLCTLPHGPAGDHPGEDPDGNVIAAWPRDAGETS